MMRMVPITVAVMETNRRQIKRMSTAFLLKFLETEASEEMYVTRVLVHFTWRSSTMSFSGVMRGEFILLFFRDLLLYKKSRSDLQREKKKIRYDGDVAS